LIRTINNASKQNSDDESSEQLEDKIFALMDALEREQEDVEKDLGLVDGTFSLLFTGGATDASEKERKQKEGKIGSFVTKVTGSSSSARKKKTKSSSSSSSNSKNFQIIDLENERVENRADLLVFNRVPVSVRIFGSCVRTTGDDCSYNSASSSAAAAYLVISAGTSRQPVKAQSQLLSYADMPPARLKPAWVECVNTTERSNTPPPAGGCRWMCRIHMPCSVVGFSGGGLRHVLRCAATWHQRSPHRWALE
jgi:hypothetical protein